MRLVAGREIRERMRSKAMRISTGVTLLIILAVAVLPGLIGDEGRTTYDVGVFGPEADQLADRLPVVAALSGENVAFDVRRLAGVDEAERLVRDGDLDAALSDTEVVVDEELGDRLGFLVQEANRQVTGESALAAAGVGADVAARVLTPEPWEVRALDPRREEERDGEGLVLVGTWRLYGQLLGFGYWVAAGWWRRRPRGSSRSCWPRPRRPSCWPGR